MDKKTIDDLAIFGGKSLFNHEIHIGRPNTGRREILLKRINHLLDRRWLTNNGPFVQAFERKIEACTGVKHCVAVSNGTVALELMIRALGLSGEVIVPSFTFISTVHALQWHGLTPVFCDIHPHTHNIDPDHIEALVTDNTTAILGVHLWGRPCDVNALQTIADKYNLKLIFDAAHAFGVSCQGKVIGNFGDAEFTSFHATKFVNTFEGGAVLTNHTWLVEKLRLMRNFGFQDIDCVVSLGINAKMNEVSAAMGLTMLEDLDELVSSNQQRYRHYLRELSHCPGLQLLTYNEQEKGNYQYIVAEIDEQTSPLERDGIIDIFHAENCLVRRYFYPGCHRMEPYRSNPIYQDVRLPHTEAVANRVLTLPNGETLAEKDIRRICALLRFIMDNGQAIQSRLSRC